MTTTTANIQELHVTTWSHHLAHGLPSAGKTTIARELAGRLRDEGHLVEVLDGDEIREFISAASASAARTATPTCSASASSPNCSPATASRRSSRSSRRTRTAARPSASATRSGAAYVEVHVATLVEVCSVRDVKGLYAKQAAGELHRAHRGRRPVRGARSLLDLRIESQDQTVQESAAAVHALPTERGLA